MRVAPGTSPGSGRYFVALTLARLRLLIARQASRSRSLASWPTWVTTSTSVAWARSAPGPALSFGTCW